MRFHVCCGITFLCQNVVWNKKSKGFCISNNISTLKRFSSTNTRTSALFVFYYDNKIELIVFLYGRMKLFDLWCHSYRKLQRKLFPVSPSWILECRQLVLFLKRNIMYYSFNLRCKCLSYILIKLSVFNYLPGTTEGG